MARAAANSGGRSRDRHLGSTAPATPLELDHRAARTRLIASGPRSRRPGDLRWRWHVAIHQLGRLGEPCSCTWGSLRELEDLVDCLTRLRFHGHRANDGSAAMGIAQVRRDRRLCRQSP